MTTPHDPTRTVGDPDRILADGIATTVDRATIDHDHAETPSPRTLAETVFHLLRHHGLSTGRDGWRLVISRDGIDFDGYAPDELDRLHAALHAEDGRS